MLGAQLRTLQTRFRHPCYYSLVIERKSALCNRRQCMGFIFAEG